MPFWLVCIVNEFNGLACFLKRVLPIWQALLGGLFLAVIFCLLNQLLAKVIVLDRYLLITEYPGRSRARFRRVGGGDFNYSRRGYT